ncbi:MAG: hypothetical protein ABI679_03295 [Gemmatimonadota bacterium]
MRWLIAVLGLVLTGACSSHSDSDKGKSADDPAAAPSAQSDADLLGREIYDLVDRAMSYKSAHRGRLPRSLRELGVDALTRTTTRTLSISGGVPEIVVGFRTTSGRILTSCRGTNEILEDASLSGGEFSVSCTTTSGGSTTLRTRK